MTGLALALLLARTCVAEISFTDDPRECEIMWTINQTRASAKKWSLEKQTKKFNSYWRCGKKKNGYKPKCYYQHRNRPWIKYLDGPEKPKGWPSTMSWDIFCDKWLVMRAAAERFVASRKPLYHGCDDAIDYGAPGETPSGNVQLVKCLDGRTKQRYWKFKKKGKRYARRKQ